MVYIYTKALESSLYYEYTYVYQNLWIKSFLLQIWIISQTIGIIFFALLFGPVVEYEKNVTIYFNWYLIFF